VSPLVGGNDDFELRYTEKFRLAAAEYGLLVRYERDRAAIDLGVHLTDPVQNGRKVSNVRIWFQLKGIRSTTLSPEEYAQKSEITLPIELGHLKFWFASPEPIYLVFYVESVDKFLLEDVLTIVHRKWGERFFKPETFSPNQQEVSVSLQKTSELTSAKWAEMSRHRSMRIDGPLFRGRPLGHRLDPLRCTLQKFDSADFCKLVRRLLDIHDYREVESLDPAMFLPVMNIGDEHATLARGVLHNSLEWVSQMTTQVGFGPESDFRTEGTTLSAQGPCVVLIHSNPRCRPERDALVRFVNSLAEQRIRQLLIFANTEFDPGYFGAFFAPVRGSGVQCLPLFLSEIAYILLITTSVYLEFREAVSWKHVNYLW
jgi:hypothetical protein